MGYPPVVQAIADAVRVELDLGHPLEFQEANLAPVSQGVEGSA